MASGFRDLLAWLMPWRANFTPEPVSGPYRVTVGQIRTSGAQAAGLYVTGILAGQTHEH